MKQFHGIYFFFGYFPFSESRILIFMENIQKKTSRVFCLEFLKFSGPSKVEETKKTREIPE